MQEDFRIETPENVAFAYEVAGIGSRFVAAFVDHLIVFVVWLAAFFTVLALITAAEAAESSSELLLAVLACLFLLLVAYYILFELGWSGQTPGKRLVGLRVLHSDGTPITLVDTLLRNVLRLFDFLPLYYGLGVLVMFLNQDARRLGDLAAGTVVVKERKEVTLESLAAPAMTAPMIAAYYTSAGESLPSTADWPLERLTADDYEMLSDYLRRRHQLTRSGDLARRIAGVLARKLDLAQTEYTPAGAEAFLQQLAAAYRSRMKG